MLQAAGQNDCHCLGMEGKECANGCFLFDADATA